MNILNIINKMIALMLILYLINYLTNGNLRKILTNLTNKCKKNIEKFKNTVYYNNKIFSTTLARLQAVIIQFHQKKNWI